MDKKTAYTFEDVAVIAEHVRELVLKYDEAVKQTSMARSIEIERLNELNQAQKQLDGCREALRKQAPVGTDWTRKQEQGEPT